MKDLDMKPSIHGKSSAHEENEVHSVAGMRQLVDQTQWTSVSQVARAFWRLFHFIPVSR